MTDTLKVVAGLISLVAVCAYAISIQMKYDELGKHYLTVHAEKGKLAEENATLKKMYTDLRTEKLKRDRP